MRTIGTVAFRRTFHILTEPVIVTQYGRRIGVYSPGVWSAEPTRTFVRVTPSGKRPVRVK